MVEAWYQLVARLIEALFVGRECMTMSVKLVDRYQLMREILYWQGTHETPDHGMPVTTDRSS